MVDAYLRRTRRHALYVTQTSEGQRISTAGVGYVWRRENRSTRYTRVSCALHGGHLRVVSRRTPAIASHKRAKLHTHMYTYTHGVTTHAISYQLHCAGFASYVEFLRVRARAVACRLLCTSSAAHNDDSQVSCVGSPCLHGLACSKHAPCHTALHGVCFLLHAHCLAQAEPQ